MYTQQNMINFIKTYLLFVGTMTDDYETDDSKLDDDFSGDNDLEVDDEPERKKTRTN